MQKERIHIEWILIGAMASILFSRIYVNLHEPLNVYLYGYELHHLYYGAAILLFSWFFLILTEFLETDILDRVLSLTIGIGAGFIVDELNFFFNLGQTYTLGMYDSMFNIVADLIFIGFLITMVTAPKIEQRWEEDIS